MVFVIQNTQNRDSAAMHARIDELILAVGRADEKFIGIERMTDEDLAALLKRVEHRAEAIRGSGMPEVKVRRPKPRTKRG